MNILLHRVLPEHVMRTYHVVGKRFRNMNIERFLKFKCLLCVLSYQKPAMFQDCFDDFLMCLSDAVCPHIVHI